jgi:microcystin-dependent protein
MIDPFIGTVMGFGGNFPPRGWATCSGQILSIAQNTALFSLLGTTYGGNGQTTFALPDLRGRIPIHMGQGPGLTNRNLGETGGTPTVTLNILQLPAHSHSVNVNAGLAVSPNPANNFFAATPAFNQYADPVGNTNLNASAISSVGGSQPHENMQPYLALTYVIAIEGVFPSRN